MSPEAIGKYQDVRTLSNFLLFFKKEMILYFQKRNQKADVKKNYELGTVMKPHILVKAGEMLIQVRND